MFATIVRSILQTSWRLLLGSLLVIASGSPIAEAKRPVVGYEIAVAQSVLGTLTNNPQFSLFEDGEWATRFSGLRLVSSAFGNIGVDWTAHRVDHGFLLGASYRQLVPAMIPDDAPTTSDGAGIADANINYLLRVERRRWAYALSVGYSLATDSRVPTRADGGNAAGQQVVNTQPGDDLGTFVLNGLSHSAHLRTQYQWLHRSWDVDIQGRYRYVRNGVFSVQNGVVGDEGNAVATGELLNATAHILGLGVAHRFRRGDKHHLSSRADVDLTLPQTEDRPAGAGPRALNRSLLATAQATYERAFGRYRRVGVEVGAGLSLRAPTSPLGQSLLERSDAGVDCPFTGDDDPINDGICGTPLATMRPDALVYRVQALYNDRLPWRLRLRLAAGVGQAVNFQAPPGAQGDPALGFFFAHPSDTERQSGPVAAVFDMRLEREFEPVFVAMRLGRQISPGALAAAAVVNWYAGLETITRVAAPGDRVFQLVAGVNAVRNEPAVDYTFADAGLATVFNSQSVGANAGVVFEIYQGQGVSIPLNLAYNFRYVDPNPDNLPNLESAFSEHLVFCALAVRYGGGVGSPFAVRRPGLTSGVIVGQAPLLSGTLGLQPGAAPEPRSRREVEAQRSEEEDASSESED